MNNDTIIFDVDGTLWNACPASAKGWNIGLAKLGINKKVTSEQIESVAGNPYEKCVEILLPGLQKQYPNFQFQKPAIFAVKKRNLLFGKWVHFKSF